MPGKWTEDDVLAVVANPLYVGIGAFPRVISDEQWIDAAAKAIDDMGAKEFFEAMLSELRKVFDDTNEG